jgi:hypothetical protein
MIFNNKVYDVLKYVSLVVLPAIDTLYLTLSNIWGLPYGTEIAATITAIDTLLGALIGVSSERYKKENGSEKL